VSKLPFCNASWCAKIARTMELGQPPALIQSLLSYRLDDPVTLKRTLITPSVGGLSTEKRVESRALHLAAAMRLTNCKGRHQSGSPRRPLGGASMEPAARSDSRIVCFRRQEPARIEHGSDAPPPDQSSAGREPSSRQRTPRFRCVVGGQVGLSAPTRTGSSRRAPRRGDFLQWLLGLR
jgi:hypothetical protein